MGRNSIAQNATMRAQIFCGKDFGLLERCRLRKFIFEKQLTLNSFKCKFFIGAERIS